MALEAYFDESGTHDESKVMCVAAYLFETARAKALSKEWAEVISDYSGRLTHFHMVDCAHGDGEFASLSRPERIECASRMIQLIRKYMTHGFAVSLNRGAFAELMPPHQHLGDDYQFCIWHIIQYIANWRKRSGDTSGIAYFFESGHRSQKWLDANLDRMFREPDTSTKYWPGYDSHAFIKKRSSMLIQTADLLAWQYAKMAKCYEEGRPVRRDLRALIDGHEKQYRIMHFNTDRIRELVSDARAAGAWANVSLD